jgi:GntR family transcriptional regulator / MocR family aminotransferase
LRKLTSPIYIFAMDLFLNLDLCERGLARGIYDALREAILDGRLAPNDRLPPTRELSESLGVSRHTVTMAYAKLTAEGFLEGRVGAGTFVAQTKDLISKRRAPSADVLHAREAFRKVAPIPAHDDVVEPRFDLSICFPDATLFPVDDWRRYISRELRPSAIRKARYRDPAGEGRLRDAVARWIGLSRSVRAGADDIIVTHGAQQALDIIGRVLIEPGMCVAVEEPGYPPARWLFASLGAAVVPVPVDDEGIIVEALPRRARLIYVTPSHQFPLGMPMSLERRRALLAWSERHGAAIIEDDYDSEYRFANRPLEPLQSLDCNGRVIYVGTFSKVLSPILRLGFLVAPASLIPALRAAKQLSDWHEPLTTQAALARYLDDGGLARHVQRTRRIYQQRREHIAHFLDGPLAATLKRIPSAAGLHISALLHDPKASEDEIVRMARRAGIAINGLAQFHASPPTRRGLVIGYGAIPLERLDEAMTRLSSVMKAPLSRRAG